jgi:GT2 family glycosyltransferase
VSYFNSDINLGSAGNLNKRLEWANQLGMDYVLALNHDAEITLTVYHALLDKTDKYQKIGALYPLRYLQGKSIYDLSGLKVFSMTASGVSDKPMEDLIEVAWSSSNGALYSMEPLRDLKKISPDASLWMGWEDYLYGLQLKKAGYSQWIVSSAETIDSYEYKAVKFYTAGKTIADKPVWYSYYDARNLILISLHRLNSPLLFTFILLRVLLGLLLA